MAWNPQNWECFKILKAYLYISSFFIIKIRKDFFFSLYTHVTRVSLNVFFSIFFTFSTFLSLLTGGHWTFALIVSLYDSTYCSRYLSLSTYCYISNSLSLYVLLSLSLSLSTYFSLFLSSYAHLSLSLSKKISFSHYKSTIVNKYYIFFIFSWLQIWGFEFWNLLQNLDSTHK